MRVYRVQDANGEGPYQSLTWASWAFLEGVDPDGDRDKRWPTHGALDEVYDTGEVRFGFKSPEQLASWFNERERTALEMAGFRVAVYDAPRVWPGRKQVAFDIEGAKLIEERLVTEVVS